jgi:hypothetical protein
MTMNSKSPTLAARRQEMTDEPMRKVRGRVAVELSMAKVM